MIKVDPTNTNQLVAIDGGANLYRSVTGGKVWSAAIVPAGVGNIRSIDIVDGPDGTTILAGGSTGIAQLDPALGSWTNILAATDVYAVAFSPNYSDDGGLILAVTNNAANTFLRTKLGADAWDVDIAIATLLSANTTAIPAITGASLAFPNDYDWVNPNQVYVGITDAAALADVYRVNGAIFGVLPSVKDLGVDLDVTSVAVDGSSTDATIVAATNNAGAGGITASTDADTVNAPTWTPVKKGPTGAAPFMMTLDGSGNLYVGTAGADTGFFKSTDMNAFNGISRMEVANVAGAAFVGGGPDRLVNGTMWFSKASGAWVMMLNNGAKGLQGTPAGAAGSKVLYAAQVTTPKQLVKTVDGGQTFAPIPAPGAKAVTALVVIGDAEYWIGYTGGIRKNTGVGIAVPYDTEDVTNIYFVGTTGILVKTNQANYAYSADSGATFTKLDKAAGVLSDKFDAASKTIYATDGIDIFTWVLGSSTAWAKVTAPTVSPIPAGATGVDYVSGVYYAYSAAAGLQRNVGNGWYAVPKTDGTDAKGAIGPGPVIIMAGTDGSYTYEVPFAAGKKFSYTDTLIKPIVLAAPANGAEINNPVTLNWGAASVPGVTYEYTVAYDKDFTLVAVNPTPTPNTTVMDVGPAAGLATDQTYYWRVRVKSVAASLDSKWSAAGNFIVKTMGNDFAGITDATRIFPSNGATGISTSPILTWGLVQGATYNVKIATDSAFTNIVDSKDGLTLAVYTPAVALEAGKAYYWEVQAVAGGIKSDWVASAFTTAVPVVPTATSTATQPVVTPTFTVNIPTQPTPTYTFQVPTTTAPAPTTPAYIWVIIVIGAVLVVAVIVLVIRTRRV